METRITPHTTRVEQQHYAHPKHGSQKSLVYFESSLKPITLDQKLNYMEVFRQTDVRCKHKKPILQIQKKLQ